MSTSVAEAEVEPLWVLLAVGRFGSVGSNVQAGNRLVNAGLIQVTKDGHELTTKGESWVRRINRARR